jgi:hypothetical protein
MMNFSANNLLLLKSYRYNKATIFYFKDKHTNRTYKLYDYQKTHKFSPDTPYCVSGKINSAAGKLYLIIETAKIDQKNSAQTPTSRKKSLQEAGKKS